MGNGYIELSGTSFAAPVISGIAAQVLARNPSWTPDQVKSAVMRRARPVPGATQRSCGVGQVNAVQTVLATLDTPNPNKALNRFLKQAVDGSTVFDAVSWTDVSWSDVSWDAVSWSDVSWSDVSWDAVSWSDVSWTDVSWSDVSWSDVSWEDNADGETLLERRRLRAHPDRGGGGGGRRRPADAGGEGCARAAAEQAAAEKAAAEKAAAESGRGGARQRPGRGGGRGDRGCGRGGRDRTRGGSPAVGLGHSLGANRERGPGGRPALTLSGELPGVPRSGDAQSPPSAYPPNRPSGSAGCFRFSAASKETRGMKGTGTGGAQ